MRSIMVVQLNLLVRGRLIGKSKTEYMRAKRAGKPTRAEKLRRDWPEISPTHEPRGSGKMKWTFEARELLYSQLVARFGPHKDWETSTRPGRGLDEEYDLFCENFAKTIRSKSGKAVKH
jgi:hypothetical protein